MKDSLVTTDRRPTSPAEAPAPTHLGSRVGAAPKQSHASGPMVKRMLAMLGIALLFIVGIGAWKVWQIRTGIAQAGKFAPPPTAVTTAVAKSERWEPVLSAVGS